MCGRISLLEHQDFGILKQELSRENPGNKCLWSLWLHLATLRPAQEVSQEVRIAHKRHPGRWVGLRSLLETQPSNIILHFINSELSNSTRPGGSSSSSSPQGARVKFQSGEINKVFLLRLWDFAEVRRIWGFTGGKDLGTNSPADRAELHSALRPQSEKPRLQNKTWKQKYK